MNDFAIRWARRAAVATSVFSLLMLAGCSTAPKPEERAGYVQSLNKYFEGRPMCLWPEPVKFPANVTAGQADDRGFDALVDAGLLTRRRSGGDSYMFELTQQGRSALDPDPLNKGAGNFCYGRRKIVSIDNARQNSRTTELVEFRYAVQQPAAWVKQTAIGRAFPQVMSELTTQHKAHATLLNTTDGWQVKDQPATVGPKQPQRPSTLAKADAFEKEPS